MFQTVDVSPREPGRLWRPRVMVMVAALLAPPLGAHAQAYPSHCGAPEPIRGDYIGNRKLLGIVEQHHFTPRIEALIRGDGDRRLGSNLDYTLRSFPNHHRALLAVRRLAEKEKADPPVGTDTSVECYMQRAIIFREDDTVARMIYADYLVDRGRKDEAVAQLRLTESHAANNAVTLNNLGLIYAKLRNYDEALRLAHRSMALGLRQPLLKSQLVAAGRWQEPPAEPVAAASQPGASAPSAALAPTATPSAAASAVAARPGAAASSAP